MKTLFVSDLDGTLLNNDAALSDYSIKTINALIAEGMHFTVATARSPWTVLKIIENLQVTCPAVLLNGVCVYDIKKSKFIKTHGLNDAILTELLPVIHEHDLSGFLYMIENDELIVFYENIVTPQAAAFMKERTEKFGKKFVRAYPFTEYNFLNMNPVYYTVSDQLPVLAPFYKKVKDIKGLRAEFYRDVYNKDLYFLEVLSENASKSGAVDFLKENYDFDRVVAFGDNLNDLPMFDSADYCLAVENAHDEVKSKANAIIKSNTENGVAEWLKENYREFI